MKKTFVILIVISFFAVGLFAADPPVVPASSFDVKTSVEGINKMKITAAKFTGTTDFDSASALVGHALITTAGAVTNSEGGEFSAWISTLSNRRTGYKVTMNATPMTSTVGSVTGTIHYTVTVGGSVATAIDTSDASGGPGSGAKDVITVSSLNALASESKEITLSVDSTSFAAAVEGDYTGTVTFTYTAT